jgi:serine phosphatase RsbU (regulator of sigma subunit)
LGARVIGDSVITEDAPDLLEVDERLPAGVAVPRTAKHAAWGPWGVGVAVMSCGLLLTGALAVGTRVLRNDNEDRLLRQRVHEAATVITGAIPNVQSPLLSAATVADTTNGDRETFREVLFPSVATGRPFRSASLWRVHPTSPRPLIVVGVRPELASRRRAVITSFLNRVASSSSLTINNLLNAPDRRLGYAFSLGGAGARYVVYAEAAIPKDRRARVDQNSAFNDLDYAIYLGDAPDTNLLIGSSIPSEELPFRGRHHSEAVPFGDTKLRIVMSPRGDLGGELLRDLPWALLVTGFFLSLGAAILAGRLVRRRQHAEELATANAWLFAQQRTVAQTLQHSLLPEVLPEIAGARVAVRYIAGAEDVEIGGDWYDVVALDDGRALFVVGDVSGRGLRAAAIMAALRFGARAYAAEGDEPDIILSKLSRLLSVDRDGHFATVLCGILDPDARTLVVANAGHLQPLMITDEGAAFLDSHVGLPIGVSNGSRYDRTEIGLAAHGTLLAFTDGLVERRGQMIDVGLERLRRTVVGNATSLDEMLDHVVDDLARDSTDDDTALLGVAWPR